MTIRGTYHGPVKRLGLGFARHSPGRAARILLAGSLAACALLSSVPAHAATTPTTDPRQIAPGVLMLGGNVTGPGLSKPRNISAVASANFMKSWLPYSIFGHPVSAKPPKSAPVYRVTILQQWQGQEQNLTVLYARQGTSAWVTMPPQNFGWASVATENWITAQSLTITAFDNATGPLPSPTASTTAGSGSTASSKSGTSAGVWVALGAAVVVILAIGISLASRRRRPAPPAAGTSRTPVGSGARK
jgi:hypothetical protein